MKYLIYYNAKQPFPVATGEDRYYNKPTGDIKYLLFEHSVMHDVYWKQAKTHKAISILPYNYKQKIERMKHMPKPYRNLGGKAYREGFTYLMSHEQHHPIYESIHKELPDKMGLLLHDVFGIKIPEQCPPIYCNFWEMEYSLFEQYIVNWLTPSIHYMIKNRSVYFAPTRYKRLPEHLQILFNRKHYPIAPFILERLVSVFLTTLK
jgi:hypothetical protein